MPENELTLRIGRREFTRAGVLALLSGVAITMVDCGSSSSPSPTPTPTPTPTGDVVGSVSANHGHSAVILAAQITAGNAVSLDITGQANHPHTVDLSASDVAAAGAHQQVQKTSSTNSGHDHVVTFN
jgi:hypothetical protein